MGWQLLFEGHCDDAIVWFDKARTAEPGFHWAHCGLCSSFHQKGMTEQALAEAICYLGLIGFPDAAEAIQHANSASGYRAAMTQAAEILVARSESEFVPGILIARLYAYAQNSDLALDWLEKAYGPGEPFLLLLGVDVDWDCLRDEPRFSTLLDRIGLNISA